MITTVCQSFGVFFFKFPRHLHTLVNQRTLSPFNAFNILGRSSSSSAAFPDFNLRMTAATYVNVKTSFFPKSIASHVPVGVQIFNGTKKHKLPNAKTKVTVASINKRKLSVK